jgi:hypothetical protein
VENYAKNGIVIFAIYPSQPTYRHYHTHPPSYMCTCWNVNNILLQRKNLLGAKMMTNMENEEGGGRHIMAFCRFRKGKQQQF